MHKPDGMSARRGRKAREMLLAACWVFLPLITLATALQLAYALSPVFLWKFVALYCVGGAAILALGLRHLAADRFGAANTVTLARGGIMVLLFAFLGEVPIDWPIALLAVLAISLDGLDGWLARRFGTASDFGARFDMETDALLLVGLTILAWQHGKAGPWILLAGFMRYGFVAAARLIPSLGRPLPASRRRKTAYVIQVIAVIASLVPWIVQPHSGAIALLGLTALTASFSIDICYLARVRSVPMAQSQA